jgi:hypothetical protein
VAVPGGLAALLVLLVLALVVPSGLRAGRRRRRLAAEPPDAALDRVVTALTTERFAGRPAEADVGRDARRVVDALRASSTPRRRAAALLAPRSLWASTGARRPRRA